MVRCIPPPVDTSYRWANEVEDSLSVQARACVAADLALAVASTPDIDTDVEYHASRLGTRIGISRGRALMFCDIGLMLQKMPRLAELLKQRSCFALPYLNAITVATYAVDATVLPAVEEDIFNYLHPARDLQAIPGIRTFKRTLFEIVEAHDPLGANEDEQQADDTAGEQVSYLATEDSRFAGIMATLRKDRACEFMKVVAAIRQSEAKAGRDCTWGDALMHMARGSASASVVMNVFRHEDGGPLWLDGAGWLSDVATQQWTDRATHVRISADSSVSGYTPSEAQVARVRGRDGTCRFPGCSTPADQCDLDHIQAYDHQNPQLGGLTDTQNLHCLCRRHHNVKTNHLWEISAHADGTETWTSCDGTLVAVSVPTGPLAGFGRQTFDQRLTRKSATIRECNERNQQLHLIGQEALKEGRKLVEQTTAEKRLLREAGNETTSTPTEQKETAADLNLPPF